MNNFNTKTNTQIAPSAGVMKFATQISPLFNIVGLLTRLEMFT